MADYIQVAEDEGEEPMEIPVEDDGTLLLSTLTAQFPGSCGLRFRNPESGAFRGVRVHEGRLYPPDIQEGWSKIPMLAVFPKYSADTSGDNKRKGDPSADNPIPKTKKLENIKCMDLICLGLDYNTTEETMREYFGKFGKTVLCEIKKRPDGKSRGFGFVKFIDYSIQREVLNQRHDIDGRRCDVKIPASKEQDEQSRRVFIGRVPETMTQDDLRNYFQQFGGIEEIFMPRPYRPFAFVTFDNGDVAQSLCGESHTVNDTSLLVRSAAPRQVVDGNMDGCDIPNDSQSIQLTKVTATTNDDLNSQMLKSCSVHLTDMYRTFTSAVEHEPINDIYANSVINGPVSDTSQLSIPTNNSQSVKNCSVNLSNLSTNDNNSHDNRNAAIRNCSVLLSDVEHGKQFSFTGNTVLLYEFPASVTSNSVTYDEFINTKPCSVVLSDVLYNDTQYHALKPCSVVLCKDDTRYRVLKPCSVVLCKDDTQYRVLKPCSVVLCNEDTQYRVLKPCSVVLCNEDTQYRVLKPCSVVLSPIDIQSHDVPADSKISQPCSVILCDYLVTNARFMHCCVILDDCMSLQLDGNIAQSSQVLQTSMQSDESLRPHSVVSSVPSVPSNDRSPQTGYNSQIADNRPLRLVLVDYVSMLKCNES